MAELRRQLDTLARSPLPLLIEGETGTGKSFLAEQVIHPRSGAKGPLVVTDLSTVPPALLAAHLFGARRGAYTGAVEDHAGVFEQAHGGTLFLDEIANLDLELQRQLLLVLERGVVTRLGDTRPRPATPKLVAATQRGRRGAGARRAVPRRSLHAAQPGDAAARAAAARAPRGSARAGPLRVSRGAALGAAAAAGARVPGAVPDAGRLRRRRERRRVRPAARRRRRGATPSRCSSAAKRSRGWSSTTGRATTASCACWPRTRWCSPDPAPRRAAPAAAAARAPAVLEVPDPLVTRLLGAVATAARQAPPAGRAGGARRIEVEIAPEASFARVSADVERQYLRALFEACDGDLARMAHELLGPRGTARQVHLRLNQLGLRLRDMRGTRR